MWNYVNSWYRSGRSCRTFTSMYPVQLEDRIHWIIATLSLRMPTKPAHFWLLANRTTPPFSSHRNINKGSHRNPRWRGKWRVGPPIRKLCCRRFLMTSTGTCSSDVSEFTDVALSFVNTLTEQATETITVRTFPNQKPWVDRTIRDAVNKRTAAYNEALLSGNMSVYKASCYALRRAVSAAKHRYKERIESHFQLNDSRRMWQGLGPSVPLKQILRGGESRSVTGWWINHLLRPLWMQWRQRGSAEQHVRKQQAEKRESLWSPCRRTRFGGPLREWTSGSGQTWRNYMPGSEIMRWSASGLFTSIFNESLATSVVPTSFKKSIIIPVPKNNKPSCLNDYRPVALTSIVMKVFERLVKSHISSSIPVTLDPLQFAYRPNRSTDDAISHILHSSLTHIDRSNGNYARLLFIDYSLQLSTP